MASEMQERRNPLWSILPVVVFAGLAILFWMGLQGEPSRLPSTLIGKPAPTFNLQSIDGMNTPAFEQSYLKRGKVTLVNIFASWCVPCRDEHPLLMELSKRSDIVIAGLNNKDSTENARRFLGSLGNPYEVVGADTDGRVTIDWGGYGVPETFVVDGNGIIRHKIIGPLSPQIIQTQLNPAIEKAKTPL
jgi:cytochrome c biogenesis protein CcmG, thiol:disulfide interchange protein DsbE